VGKFVGENFYRGNGAATAVPLLDNLWLLVLFGLTMTLIAARKLIKKDSQ